MAYKHAVKKNGIEVLETATDPRNREVTLALDHDSEKYIVSKAPHIRTEKLTEEDARDLYEYLKEESNGTA